MNRIPLLPADYPPVLWVRSPDDLNTMYLVLTISPMGFFIADKYSLTLIPRLDIIRWEYSADRVEWKPCYKEIP